MAEDNRISGSDRACAEYFYHCEQPGAQRFHGEHDSRLSYLFEEPQRGDIVIFRFPDNEKIYYVKRVIGLPGETVDIHDGHVYLNGSEEPLEEGYIREPMIPEEPAHYEVPDGCYFMLGDNRNYSADARVWQNTYVKKEKIVAKVLFRYFPKIGKIE